MVKASNAYGDVAKNVKMPPEIEIQMARTSLRSILKQVAKSITPADVQQLNAALNKIKKSLIYLSYAHALSQFKLLFCVTLLNTLSEEKKSPENLTDLVRSSGLIIYFLCFIRA